MFLNIITPCSRPENLKAISKSINIPSENYRWIVVFDASFLPDKSLIPSNCEVYCHQDFSSVCGNAQRNYAMNKVFENSIEDNSYIYFNDDDTIMHPNLWNFIKNVNEDLLTFPQSNKDGSPRLAGTLFAINHIDSHNFVVKSSLVKNIRWELNQYAADGKFASECASKTASICYIPAVLSIYNFLRE